MRKGFTLIELLIVITILGILSSIGVGNFMSSRLKARDLSRKSDLSTIAKSLEAYVNDHRSYPLSDENGYIICKSNSTTCPWGTPFSDENGTIYVAKLPSDTSSQNYIYESNGKTYTLYTNLENTQDPAIIVPPVSCGTSKTCNYKITSSNQ